MIKLKPQILIILFLLSTYVLIFSGCSVNNKIVNETIDSVYEGAYFITDNSYRDYLNNCAEKVGADNAWVEDVINGGDGGEWSYLLRPKNYFWCAIADNKITVSGNEIEVFDIKKDSDAYSGYSFNSEISFWFENDVLNVKNQDVELQYKKDVSYTAVDTQPVVLSKAEAITSHIGDGDGLNFLTIQWNYKSEYGSIGAVAEIKTAESQEYSVKKFERVYMNQFTMQFGKSDFALGKNFLRIYHVGGPTITNYKQIIIRKNSDYVTFCITVSNDGAVIEEI